MLSRIAVSSLLLLPGAESNLGPKCQAAIKDMFAPSIKNPEKKGFDRPLCIMPDEDVVTFTNGVLNRATRKQADYLCDFVISDSLNNMCLDSCSNLISEVQTHCYGQRVDGPPDIVDFPVDEEDKELTSTTWQKWLNTVGNVGEICKDDCLSYFCEKKDEIGFEDMTPACTTTSTTVTSTSTLTTTQVPEVDTAPVSEPATTLDPLSGILGDGLTMAPAAAVLPVAAGSMPADVGAANALGGANLPLGSPDLLNGYVKSVESTVSVKCVGVFASLAASAAMMVYFVLGRRNPVTAEDQEVLTVGE